MQNISPEMYRKERSAAQRYSSIAKKQFFFLKTSFKIKFHVRRLRVTVRNSSSHAHTMG